MRARDLLAVNVSKLRVARGLSQEKLAADARVDRAYMGKIERRTENPSLDILDRLADALGVPVAALFEIPQSPDERPARLRSGRRPARDAEKPSG